MKGCRAIKYVKELEIKGSYDLVVCGGGPSGIPAALAARRAGLSVLLIEGTGQLGGAGTSAGVSHLLGGRTPDNERACVAGIFEEITQDLVREGGAYSIESRFSGKSTRRTVGVREPSAWASPLIRSRWYRFSIEKCWRPASMSSTSPSSSTPSSKIIASGMSSPSTRAASLPSRRLPWSMPRETPT